jgi:L-iditol 2-dehydrogenase
LLFSLRGYNNGVRQAVLQSPGHLTLSEVPIPEPGPGEVLVRVKLALTCGTDLKTYRRGHAKLPLGPFGHEGSGDVVAVGAGVEHLKPGQRVTWTPTAPCNACDMCRRNRPNLCRNLMDAVVLGSFADYLLINARVAAVHVLPILPELDYLEAAFVEPLACVLHGWRLLEPLPGNRICIVGTGTMGLLHLMEAKRRGCKTVVMGRREERLRLARELGADECFLMEHASQMTQWTDGGADVVIEATGAKSVWEETPNLAAPGGKILFYSGLASGEHVRFSAEQLHYRELTLIGTFHYTTTDVYDAYERLKNLELKVRQLITAVRPLSEIVQVFQDLDAGIGMKYAVVMDE